MLENLAALNQGTGTWLRTCYIDVTGDIISGLLLSQIVYWFSPDKNGNSKLSVKKNGVVCLAKKVEDWYTECRITQNQFRRAVQVLKNKRFISVKNHIFMGVKVNHIFLNVENLAAELKGIMLKTHNALSVNNTMHCVKTTQSYTKTTQKNTSKILAQAPKEIIRKKEEEKKRRKEGEKKDKTFFTCGDKIMKVDDVLKSKKLGESNTANPNNVKGLILLYKKRMSQLQEGFVKQPTMKECGQLKMFFEKVPSAHETLDWILKNWGLFAWEAKSVKGLGCVPTLPDIGFILKFHDVGVNIFNTSKIPNIDKPINNSYTQQSDGNLDLLLAKPTTKKLTSGELDALNKQLEAEDAYPT